MKKWILAISIVGLVSMAGLGVVMAQDTAPETPVGPGCANCPYGGAGYAGNQALHDYMSSALADALGISVEDFLSYRAEGQTFYQIAAALHLDMDTVTDKLSQVRQDAIEAAFADGALTQDQYDYLMERAQFGNRFGGGMAGNGTGKGFGQQQNRGNGGRGAGGYGMQDCPYNQSAPAD